MTAQPSPEKYRAMLYGVAYTKATRPAPRSQEAATLTSCSSGTASQLPTLRLSALVFRKFRSG